MVAASCYYLPTHDTTARTQSGGSKPANTPYGEPRPIHTPDSVFMNARPPWISWLTPIHETVRPGPCPRRSSDSRRRRYWHQQNQRDRGPNTKKEVPNEARDLVSLARTSYPRIVRRRGPVPMSCGVAVVSRRSSGHGEKFRSPEVQSAQGEASRTLPSTQCFSRSGSPADFGGRVRLLFTAELSPFPSRGYG
jgi:hypothetical protein